GRLVELLARNLISHALEATDGKPSSGCVGESLRNGQPCELLPPPARADRDSSATTPRHESAGYLRRLASPRPHRCTRGRYRPAPRAGWFQPPRVPVSRVPSPALGLPAPTPPS